MSNIETPLTPFFFMRHGPTVENNRKITQGRIDTPLSTEGVALAKDSGKRIDKESIDGIVTSSLLRASQTAEIISDVSGIPILAVSDQLVDRNFGDFEGKDRQLIFDQIKSQTEENVILMSPPNGETWAELTNRSVEAIHTTLEHYKEKSILFVSHHVVFMSYFKHMCDSLLMHMDNAQLYQFSQNKNIWKYAKAT